MSYYQNSYRRTVAAASAIFSLAILTSIASLIWMSAAFAFPAPVTLLFSLFCLAVATVAGLVAVGGVIGLSRDAIELSGQPYYSNLPRECASGAFVYLRRRLLSMLPGSPARLRLWPGEWVKVRPFAEISTTLDDKGQFGRFAVHARDAALLRKTSPCVSTSRENPPLLRPYGTSPAAFAGAPCCWMNCGAMAQHTPAARPVVNSSGKRPGSSQVTAPRRIRPHGKRLTRRG